MNQHIAQKKSKSVVSDLVWEGLLLIKNSTPRTTRLRWLFKPTRPTAQSYGGRAVVTKYSLNHQTHTPKACEVSANLCIMAVAKEDLLDLWMYSNFSTKFQVRRYTAFARHLSYRRSVVRRPIVWLITITRNCRWCGITLPLSASSSSSGQLWGVMWGVRTLHSVVWIWLRYNTSRHVDEIVWFLVLGRIWMVNRMRRGINAWRDWIPRHGRV